jgi:cellulose synthase/poly-beta-1,6-N-acetylglucosamine synthase-like glycosyltransferase/glycosyltransferase involved in cell wall biosynthesis
LKRLLAELASARSEIDQIYSSPAWAVVSRYRRWLRQHQLRNSATWKIFEPMAAWALRRAGLSFTDANSAKSTEEVREQQIEMYQEWISSVDPSASQLWLQRAIGAELSYRPLISVLVPVFRLPLAVLQATVDSVLEQTYGNWELCIAHADAEDAAARSYLARVSAQEPRVKLKLLSKNSGISGNSNEALSLVTGEFLALLDHDDTLTPSALFEVAQALQNDPTPDFIYSDKDQIDESGARRMRPLFKPEWSPEMMLSANYVTHLNVMRTERVRQIGGWRPETDGAQDWDLFLRFTTNGCGIHHIPKILYHWRQLETSVAMRGFDAKPYAAAAQIRALRDHLTRMSLDADVTVSGKGLMRLSWGDSTQVPVTVIIVPNSRIADTILFAEKILKQTSGDLVEVLIPTTARASASNPRIRLVPVEASQSLAMRLNVAADTSAGNALVFLDQGVLIDGPLWIREMTGPLSNPEIGIVGVKLIDEQSRLMRHAGLVFDDNGRLESVFAREPEEYHEAFGPAYWYRNWLAVSGACFSIKRETFARVGGFRERPDYPRLDVDLCLRVRSEMARRIVYNPFARMLQRESAKLERWLDPRQSFAGAAFIERCFPQGDPFFSPNLVCINGTVGLDPRRVSLEPESQFALEARGLVTQVDFTEAMISASKAACSHPPRRRLDTVAWFIPTFTNPFYGGVHTILRFADYFRRKHGVRSSFAVVEDRPMGDVRAKIAMAFPELAENAPVIMLTETAEAAALPPSDAAVATFWKTAYPVLVFNQTRKKFCFLQDYEPLFYPAGSTSALAESTYRFGYFGICNTLSLRQKYEEQGGVGEHFDPCVDTSIFHRNGRAEGRDECQRVFFYARPGHPRNGFELIAAAMKILKSRRGNRVRIVAAGSEWSPTAYGLEGIVDSLGLLDYRRTALLYRSCDVGVTMMVTAHPSYLPLELMACGVLVVGNQNPRTAWLLKHRENCLVSANSASSIADAVEEGLMNRELRIALTQNAAQLVAKEYSDWDGQAEKIYQCMLDQC